MKIYDNLNLGEYFISFTKKNVNKFVPHTTGIYMLGVKLGSDYPITPVYIGRATGEVQHLNQRVRRYLRVLYGRNGQDEVVDVLLNAINNPQYWFISWKEYSPGKAKKIERTILKNTNLKLVNAIGRGKGCKSRAINYAEELKRIFNNET